MKLPRYRNVKFFFCCGKDDLLRNRQHLYWWIHCFTSRPLIRKLIAAYAKRKRLGGIAFLQAHGKTYAPEFLYNDMGKWKRVQDWIDSNDGKFKLLIVTSCNNQNYSIVSHHSIVIHLNCSINIMELMQKRGRVLRVYVPHVGYVESNRNLIKKLIASN